MKLNIVFYKELNSYLMKHNSLQKDMIFDDGI